MRVVLLAAILVFTSSSRAEGPGPQTFSFEKDKVGTVPAGWKTGVTGKADGSVWKIEQDKTAPGGANVLSQTSKNESAIFNICTVEAGKYQDVDITVAFKAVAGMKDQGGGIMWRCKDNNNYYVVRMNPLEDNFRLYAVIDGKRKQLGGDADVKAEAGKWHTIRVIHTGNKIQCFINGKKMYDVTDESFKEAGKIGLWTKSDAQTLFANLQITAKKE